MWTLRRRAARAVVLDGDDRLLLLQARDPANAAKGVWWELPGGGIEEGESSAEAAARELYEETGIEAGQVSDCVWMQQARYTFAGLRFDQEEFVHVARVEGPVGEEYRPGGLESMEALAFQGVRWWTVDELDAYAVGGGRLIPPWLPPELRLYLERGAPGEPIDMGELPDIFADC